MINPLLGAIEALQNLAHGDADEFAALDQVLDSCVSALEEADLIDECFDIVEAVEQLVKARGLAKILLDVADELRAFSEAIQYGQFPEDKIGEARQAVEALASCLEELLEQEQSD